MYNYLTPEETAQQLKVGITEILSLIDQGKLRAIRIGKNIRIPQAELERLPVTCAARPIAIDSMHDSTKLQALSDNVRWCPTRTGRAKFRVSGSIATGAEIWPGKMPYPIKFPKTFFNNMLVHFRNAGDVPVGGSFDGPSRGSLGKFIQQKLGTKMNPAVYVAALLIQEGYAEASRRGYIRFRSNVKGDI